MDDRTRIDHAVAVLNAWIGMQEKHLAHILEEYRQAPSSDHRYLWQQKAYEERRIRDAYVASLKLLTGDVE